AGRLLLGVHGRDHRREELAKRRLETLGEGRDVVDHRLLAFLVRHTYPCTAMRMTPVTVTFAIAYGSSTFQLSRTSMSLRGRGNVPRSQMYRNRNSMTLRKKPS